MSCLKGPRGVSPGEPDWCDRRSRRSSQESRPFESACLPGRMRSASPRLASWSFMERAEGCVTRRLRARRNSKPCPKSRSRTLKNALNSARWNHILSALEKMGVPPYLRRIIASYFSDRVLEYSTDDGAETYSVTAGVPPGIGAWPHSWNAMYNKILGLRLPEQCRLSGLQTTSR
ncbi:unnamed protein product [Trichogramma brassicae]|uniref:Reverse transcriptase domain-containing protein n=1 Tax=Trichogramma brassicae TaxID=86971 RepID=A0A6H5I2P7_9HYME|nr:unnamed protein product [Trichogramma brassicae]